MKDPDIVHSGKCYDPAAPEIVAFQVPHLDLCKKYNKTRTAQGKKRARLLKKMLADCGDGVYIEAPFYANFGGAHCHIGDHVYANFGLTLVDDTHITIGARTKIGPRVTIATAAHPIHPSERRDGTEYNKPVHIGADVWIGAGAVILPGITVGDGAVIGAGAVVTRDVPPMTVAVGNPARVMRKITEGDKMTGE